MIRSPKRALLFVIVLGFGGTVNILFLAIVSFFICAIIWGVLLFYVVVGYQRAFDPESLRTRNWLYRQIPAMLVAPVLVEAFLLLAVL